MKIIVNRNSVCMGDDVDSHEAIFELNNPFTLKELILKAEDSCQRPSMSSWVVELEFINQLIILGVIGIDINDSYWNFPLETDISEITQDTTVTQINIFFDYFSYATPKYLWNAHKSGKPFPKNPAIIERNQTEPKPTTPTFWSKLARFLNI